MSTDDETPRAANEATRPEPFDAAARHANELERQLAEANRVGKALAMLVERQARHALIVPSAAPPTHTTDRELAAAVDEARKQGWLP